MKFVTNVTTLVVALAAIANAVLDTNPTALAIALITVTEASVVTNTITFVFTMAAFATAKPIGFSYYGVMTRADNGCRDMIICYAVQDDAGGEDWEGYFKGCHSDEKTPGGFIKRQIFTEGTFKLKLTDFGEVDKNSMFAAALTNVPSGVSLEGFERFELPNDMASSEYPNAMTVCGNGDTGGWVHEPMDNPTCKGW